ncbi:MAG: endonuclease/exonuclease/phosphatase family protein [Bdellovibrionales bacterium]|nr:endonuclease/exonuclease/phosphatase family protein [Bdellovibrionales bacterium]NQZ18676.1 endonuclease/exonuclease/phosphatase family protein [Bdellovibrionales bacterium]
MKLVLLSLLLFVVSCTSGPKKEPGAITIMTYNVENLFDNLDDPDKDDETYLPIEDKQSARHRMKCQKASKPWYVKQCIENDWDDDMIRKKMQRLAAVITQEGKGPDIVIMEEVENLNVLHRLNENHLKGQGYTEAVLIEGPDERGIDVAILSRLPLAARPKLHEVDLTKVPELNKDRKARPTRGILQAKFELPDGEHLTVFGVHFPSQGAPTPARLAAINKLNSLKRKLPKDSLAIAAGDFNITAKEDGKLGLYREELAKEWLVSHYIGCDDCEGTHSYRGSWSFLDAILFSKNMKFGKRWSVDSKSLRVVNKSVYQMNYWGSPARFSEGRSHLGVSDHYPLAVEIVPNKVVR